MFSPPAVCPVNRAWPSRSDPPAEGPGPRVSQAHSAQTVLPLGGYGSTPQRSARAVTRSRPRPDSVSTGVPHSAGSDGMRSPPSVGDGDTEHASRGVEGEGEPESRLLT